MKIPENATNVFQGVIFDVWQWEQEMFDGSTATFEALTRPDVIQIIPTMNGKVLLGYEEQPTYSRRYSTLGGRQEKGEDVLTCAKRELLEETGLESDDWEHFKTYQTEGKVLFGIHFYIARNCHKVAEPNLDPGERIDVQEFDFDEYIRLITASEFWGKDLSLDIYRMKENGELESFKNRLFKM